MANKEHLNILKQGVEVWNKWRKENPDVVPDLVEANLSGAKLSRAKLSIADLSGADLSRANLNEANLRWANLIRANLSEVNLSRANLGRVNLIRADLSKANLIEADLSKALLTEAKFSWADLSEADLSGAMLWETVFVNANLAGAIGLDKCRHQGPSTIDHRTLRLSGTLPLQFLRGCGLPDSMIEYLPSLLGQPWEYYSCFISYSTKDQDFADRLYADLQSNGVRCWFAPADMQAGKKMHEQIDEAIRRYERLLLILSENSMDSEWVKTEIANARKREVEEGKQILFPIGLVDYEKVRGWKYFDGDIGKDSAREIREYFIPDFQHWKTDHDTYKKSLGRLLHDLKDPGQGEASEEA